MPESHAAAYAGVRERTTTFLRATDPALLDKPTPATPEWRGRDVLAHLVGITDDVVAGRLEGIATEPWTAAQVEARHASTVHDLLDEWMERSPAFEAMLTQAPAEIAGQAVFDAATHEHDLRHALGVPGARDSDAIAISWEWITGARTRGGMPAIKMTTERGETVAGIGDPTVAVEASEFELFRASTGRRSTEEVEQYHWSPTCQPELLLAGPIFTLRDQALNE